MLQFAYGKDFLKLVFFEEQKFISFVFINSVFDDVAVP